MINNNKIEIDYSKSGGVRESFVLFVLEKLSPLHAFFCAREREPWNLGSDDLIRFPKGSLGNKLGIFYKQHGFEPVPRAERHDVFHVLLGYSVQVKDEIAMQFFLLGNGKPSLFTAGTIILGFLLFPADSKYFISAFRRGRMAVPIGKLNFRALLSSDFPDLQIKIFNS